MTTGFRYLLIIFLFTVSVTGHSQSNPIDYSQQLKMPTVLPASPDASAIEKFGNIPVGYSTGVPDISIPVYTIKCGSLGWNVALSYHAAGIRVDEVASSAGLGWSVIAPGVITRAVVGLADEIRNDEPAYSNSTNYYSTNPDYLIGVVNGAYDSELDIFNFNFNGRSGKFVIKQDGNILQVPNSDLKITYTANLASFTITDENGITYLFDQKETTDAQTYPVSTYTSNKSAWYISRVEMPDKNNIIQFTYSSAGNSTQLFNTFSQAIGAKYVEIPGASVNLSSLNTRSSTTTSTTTGLLKLTGITFPNGSVVFSYDATARQDIGNGSTVTNKLSAITINQVINSITNQIKKVNLYQSYFFYHPGSGSNTPGDYRLRLDSLGELGSPATGVLKKYKFEYNTTPMVPQGNYGQDKWGFNNGQWQNASLLQSQSVDFNDAYNVINYSIGDANRSVDTSQMKACMLTAINWPTGGKTTFGYEPHVYNDGQSIVTTTEKETHVFGDQAAPQESTTTFTYPTPTVPEFPRVIVDMSRYDFAGVYQYSRATVKDLTTSTIIYDISHMNPSQPLTKDEPIYLVAGHNYELKTYVYTNVSNYQLTAGIKIRWNNNTNQVDIKRGGGLRIKEIKNYTGNGVLAGTEQYEYDTATTLNPVNIIARAYSEVRFRLGWNHYGGANCDYIVSPVCRVYQSGPVYPVSTAIGSPILYKNVRKITTDAATGAINGKSEYNYDVILDEWYPGSGSYKMIPYISNDWKNGFLSSETHYKYSGGAFSIIKKTENKYSEIKTAETFSLRIEGSYIFEGCRIASPVATAASLDAVYYVYPCRTGSKKLTEVVETQYDDNANKIEVHTYNDYLGTQHDFITKTAIIDSKGNQDSATFKYAADFASTGNVYDLMKQRNIIASPIEQKSYSGSTFLRSIKTNYYQWSTNVIAPQTIESKTLTNAVETRLRFHSYDANGNVLSVSKENDAKASYLWGYNQTVPVAEVVNAASNEIFFDGLEEPGSWNAPAVRDSAKSHTGKYSAKIVNSTTGEITCHSTKWLAISLTAPTKYKYSGWIYSNGPYVELLLFMKRAGETNYFTYVDVALTTVTGKWVYVEKEFSVPADVTQLNIRVDNNVAGTIWFDDIRMYPAAAAMTSYTYAPLIGVTSKSDVNSNPVYYEYDGFNRLVLIRDKDRNIIKKICYNYAGQAEDCTIPYFTNVEKTGNFTKNNCASGGTPSTVTYVVPAGTYTSSTQVDANQKAQDDVNANGQAYANGNCSCTFYNVVKSGNFTRNNCASGSVAGTYNYIVAAGTLSSTISQAAADQRAQDTVNANGQTQANINAVCTWYNVAKSGNFTRNNCASGGTPGTVTYTVAAGLHSSTTSQAAADLLAQNAVNANGQSYANANATCTFYNATQIGYFTKNNCPGGQTGSSVPYTVAAGLHSSTTSQAAADQLAVNAVNAGGQSNANTIGSCLITVSGSNITSTTFYAQFTNTSTSQVYSMNVSGGSMNIPPGTYNIYVYQYDSYFTSIQAMGNYTYGYSLNVYSVSITAAGTVTIGN